MTSSESPPVGAVLERLVDEHGFESITVERELSGGMFARPLLISTDRGQFVYRVHTFRNLEASFRFQAEVIAAAWQQGVPCSRVEPTRRGEWCLPVNNGGGVTALHRFVIGRSYDWTSWYYAKRSDNGFLYSLGRQVATLHNALATSTPRGDKNLSITHPPIQFRYLEDIRDLWRKAMEELRRQGHHSSSASRNQLLSFATRIERHWERLSTIMQQSRVDELPKQIVHGDISPVNMIFGSDKQAAFIDWDCVHIGHRLYDALGDVLNRLPHEQPDWNLFNFAEVEVYIDGYASRLDVPLMASERRLVPAFCLARQLEDLRQRLAVLPQIQSAEDDRYAKLIGMRVDMMDQIELN